MKKRAFWLGGILIALVVAAGIVIGFNNAPRDETGQKMNTSAEAILQPAFEVYGWFTSNPPVTREQSLFGRPALLQGDG